MAKKYLDTSLTMFENAGVPTLKKKKKRYTRLCRSCELQRKLLKTFLTKYCKENRVKYTENIMEKDNFNVIFSTNSEPI